MNGILFHGWEWVARWKMYSGVQTASARQAYRSRLFNLCYVKKFPRKIHWELAEASLKKMGSSWRGFEVGEWLHIKRHAGVLMQSKQQKETGRGFEESAADIDAQTKSEEFAAEAAQRNARMRFASAKRGSDWAANCPLHREMPGRREMQILCKHKRDAKI